MIFFVASSTETILKNLAGAVAFVLLLMETTRSSTRRGEIGNAEFRMKSMLVWRTGEAEVGSEFPVSMELPSSLIVLVAT